MTVITPSGRHLGRSSVVHNSRTFRSGLAMAASLAEIGVAPPQSNDYVAAVDKKTNGDWGMMGNDQAGDCVWADSCHQLMLRTANTGLYVAPTTADALAAYTAVTGYNPNDPSTDNGTNEFTACEYMRTTGILGHKSVAQAALDPSNIEHLKWCVQIFGGCRLGVNLPQSADDQFSADAPFTYIQGSPCIGGHDVPIVKYDGNYAYVVTWGRLVPATWEWVLKCSEEAHVELYPDWVTSQGSAPSGFDLVQMEADQKEIADGTVSG